MDMNLRNIVMAGLVASACVAAASIPTRAQAAELKEEEAHLAINIPNDWEVSTKGKWAYARTKDEHVELGLRATDGGWKQEKELEKRLQEHVNEWLSQSFIDEKWHHFDHNNYEGFEAGGHGQNSKGEPRRFFILAVRDKKDHKKGAVLWFHATEEGWKQHQKGIREAVKTLRSW
jgi:hypothetical protein